MVIGVTFLIALAVIINIAVFKFFFGWWQSALLGYVASMFEIAVYMIVSIIKAERGEHSASIQKEEDDEV